MKKEKKETGITLIALVITVIVLLILAGVTIAALSGDNGILKKATEAKEKNRISQEEESVKLSISEAITQGVGTITTKNLQTALKNNNLKGILTGDGPWTYKGEYNKYNIEKNGNVTSLKQDDNSNNRVVKLMGNYGVSENGDFFEMDVNIKNLSEGTWTEVKRKRIVNEIGKIKKSVNYEGRFYIITENGDLYGWGDNKGGQLGIGNIENQESPVKVTGVSDVEDIYTNYDNTFVKTKTGDVYAFGKNYDGSLGIGHETQQTIPVKISALSNVKEVYVGDSFLLPNIVYALTENGEVYAWGENERGYLGISDLTNQSTPVKIDTLSNIKKICYIGYSSLALTETGEVYVWGSNDYGQLGIGNTTDQNNPIKVEGVPEVEEIYTNGYSIFAKAKTGEIYVWGSNNYGELGIGNTTNQIIPVKNTTLSNIEKIYINKEDSVFAKTISGDLYAWGCNNYGQLGIGNRTNQITPVKIVQIANVDEMTLDGFVKTTDNKFYAQTGENGIFKLVDNLEFMVENDEIYDLYVFRYKEEELNYVYVINTKQGHNYVRYRIKIPD